MSAGIINKLEIIEIHVAKCMPYSLCACALHGQLNAFFKFTPVDQAGERVMGRLVGHFPGKPA